MVVEVEVEVVVVVGEEEEQQPEEPRIRDAWHAGCQFQKKNRVPYAVLCMAQGTVPLL